MKKLFAAAVFVLICSGIYAQDMIYINPRETAKPRPPQPDWIPKKPLRRADESIRDNHPTAKIIIGKVTEVTPAYIFYTKNSDNTGTLYSTSTNVIDSIRFGNGSLHRFTRESRMPARKVRERKEYADLGQNIISGSVGIFTHRIRFLSSEQDDDFTPFVNTTLSYERLFLKDRLGVEIAPFVSLNKKGYGATLHPKFYPKNYGRFRIGLGPFYKLYMRDKTTKYYNQADWYRIDVTEEVAMSVMGFGVQLQSHIERNLLINFNVNLGGVLGYSNQNKAYPGMSNSGEKGMGYAELRLGLGYRF